MKKLLFLTVALFCVIISSMGQGTIRGKVTDGNGEDLTGATVVLKENTSVATITDFEGNFSLKAPSSGRHIISISYIGHQTIEDTLIVEAGKVTISDYMLEPVAQQLEEAVIIGKANRSKDIAMQQVKMKSATNIDFITKETIKKTGDSQVTDAIKRVTGVSSVGGFITVRGLADRYVKTTINGARIPSLDPLTNNIRLDMFPTSLIDNIVINKTLNPDIPGDWAGAYLSIETKDYPQELMINIKTSIGFNPQSTFELLPSAQKSPTDWLGYDNGFRNIDHTKYAPAASGVLSGYSMLKGYGLEDYMNSLGVDESNFQGGIIVGSTYEDYNNIYYRLGLVELGVLAPGQIYDQEAAIAADNFLFFGTSTPGTRASDEYTQAYLNIATPGSEFGKMLPNNWVCNESKVPLMFSQEFSIGNQVEFLGRPLGFLAGFRYASGYKNQGYVTDSVYSYRKRGDDENKLEFFHDGYNTGSSTIQINEWSALMSASYKLSSNHSISLLYMPNMFGQSRARIAEGYSEGSAMGNNGNPYYFFHDQKYEERQQMIYQYQSNHYFPLLRLKIDANASYTDGESSEPDSKNGYKWVAGSLDSAKEGIYYFPGEFEPERRWTYIDENILDTRVNGDLQLGNKKGLTRKLKFGAAYLNNTREVGQYQYQAETKLNKLDPIPTDPLNLMDLSNFDIIIDSSTGMGTMDYYYRSETQDFLFNFGYTKITSGYAMLDFELNQRLRISGGLRLEYSNIFNDVKKFHELGLPKDDKGREVNAEGLTPGFVANPSEIKGLDYIPSVNVVYRLFFTEKLTFNSRLSYSKSLVRPSIREIAPYTVWDIDLNAYVYGNPDLRFSYIDNYDFRLESYFSSGEFISASFFYKNFTDHIEMVKYYDSYHWENAENGYAAGIELEGKKRIVKNLSMAANITLVKSHTSVTIYTDDTRTSVLDIFDRAMFGQAPYIVNGLLDYTLPKNGLSLALSYNVQGPKVALVSTSSTTPDVYEMPYHRLDFKVSKTLGKHFGVEFKMRNILQQSITRKYKYNNSFDYTYDSYFFGTDYVFSISYDF